MKPTKAKAVRTLEHTITAILAVVLFTLLLQVATGRRTLRWPWSHSQMPSATSAVRVLEPGTAFPYLRLRQMDGQVVSTRALIQSGTVVALFTPTCDYCIITFPYWLRLDRELAARDAQLVFISLADVSATRKYVERREIIGPVYSLLDPARLAGRDAVPQTITIGSHAEIVRVWVGAIEDLEVVRDIIHAFEELPRVESTALPLPQRSFRNDRDRAARGAYRKRTTSWSALGHRSYWRAIHAMRDAHITRSAFVTLSPMVPIVLTTRAKTRGSGTLGITTGVRDGRIQQQKGRPSVGTSGREVEDR